MLLKKFVFFSLILLLVPISVYPSSENSPSSKDRPSSLIPTKNGRDELVRTFLSNYEKSATQDLIDNIVELTDGYTITQVTGLVVDIIGSSKGNSLEQLVCLKKLKKAINRIDTDQMKQRKLARLKKIIHKSLFGPLSFNSDSLKEDVEPYDADAVFLTADERLKIIKEILLTHKKSASEFLIQKMVEETSGFEMSLCRNWVTNRVKASKSSSLDQDRYLRYPTPDERCGMVKEVLLLAKKSASESLIEDIVELTKYYDMYTITKLVSSMAKKSKTDSLDRNSCIEKLKKAIDSIDEEEVKKAKFAQIEAMATRESLSKQKAITERESLSKAKQKAQEEIFEEYVTGDEEEVTRTRGLVRGLLAMAADEQSITTIGEFFRKAYVTKKVELRSKTKDATAQLRSAELLEEVASREFWQLQMTYSKKLKERAQLLEKPRELPSARELFPKPAWQEDEWIEVDVDCSDWGETEAMVLRKKNPFYRPKPSEPTSLELWREEDSAKVKSLGLLGLDEQEETTTRELSERELTEYDLELVQKLSEPTLGELFVKKDFAMVKWQRAKKEREQAADNLRLFQEATTRRKSLSKAKQKAQEEIFEKYVIGDEEEVTRTRGLVRGLLAMAADEQSITTIREFLQKAHVKKIVELRSKAKQKAITSSKQGKKYPLVVADIFHPNKILIYDALKQLKEGRLIDESSKGLLFYGPPGVGKTAMAKAIANESNCPIFIIQAGGIVNKYQGSGSGEIKLTFSKAREKAAETGRSVIILIDELQELAPGTTDENVGLSDKYSGLSHRNALSKIWTEYDECIEEDDNVFLIVTCNEFELIDKRMRDRLHSLEFSCPDKKGIIEILKNKSRRGGIPLSESELKEYAKKMEGLNGREITLFIEKAKKYIRSGKSNTEALALAIADQSKAKDNARPKEQPKKSFLEKVGDTGQWMGEFAIRQVIVAGINRVIGGANSSSGTSNDASSGPPVVRSSALEAITTREQNRRWGIVDSNRR